MERQKKKIAEYKQKKAITEEMLANADLDDLEDVFDSEGDDQKDEDAGKFLDEMIDRYGAKNRRPPPAVM